MKINLKDRIGKSILAFSLVDERIDELITQARLKRNRKLKKIYNCR
jgi:hypothetical protein